jgi:hypothetical protein
MCEEWGISQLLSVFIDQENLGFEFTRSGYFSEGPMNMLRLPPLKELRILQSACEHKYANT